ncbi:MAG: hypothetical protein DDG60_15225 [Anaerolineae bacterium]|nr:MAG: hypothetical protein DDG60_15225 [Anaerolineae bacterium]
MNTPSPARWRPNRYQIVTISLALAIALAFSVFAFQDFRQGQLAFRVFNDEIEVLTTLANIQRHQALMFAQTLAWLDDPAAGKTEIEKQRTFLASQLRVLRPLVANEPEIEQRINNLQAALQEYDRLVESLGESPSPQARATARPQLIELLRRVDEALVKRAYDAQERSFVLDFGNLLRNQERARALLFGVSIAFILLVLFASGLYLRSERNTFNLRQRQIQELQAAVNDRTRALELAAGVSQRIAAIREQSQIVVEVVEQLKQTFNYYHAHIYLFDENRENLLMVGGTGEVGKTLLERGHKIPRGRGLVGRAAETSQPVLVPDTVADPAWLPNPLLPETRAEVAVPIVVGNRVLGVLDVQNNQVGSLSELDVLLISTVADQVGIALENIRSNQVVERLLQEYQQLIETSPAAIGILDAQTGVFVQANPQMLEMFELTPADVGQVGPIMLSPERQPDGRLSQEAAIEHITLALQQGKNTFEWVHHTRSGREFRAEIHLTPAPNREGRPMLNAIITDITARYEAEQQARRRAERETALNRLTQAIQGALSVEEALQITARELGQVLGRKPVLAALQSTLLSYDKEDQ